MKIQRLDDKFTKLTITIKEYLNKWYALIDVLPIAQRLPVTNEEEKREGIIGLIADGINIGEITIVKNIKDVLKSTTTFFNYDYDSIDGGHRKRYIHGFYHNLFPNRDGVFYNDLTPEEKEQFLNYKLSFVIYEPLDVFTRGYIFRALNETTQVNFMEMLNSFGDISIANLVRFAVRTVRGFDNTVHELFTKSVADDEFRFLKFDNKRLKTEEFVARIVYRHTQEKLLGPSGDPELESMYLREDLDIKTLTKKVNEHLDFLLKCAVGKKDKLTQQDFKMLSFLYYYMIDTYGKFKIEDYESFVKEYRKCFLFLTDNNKKYGNIKLNDPSNPISNVPFDNRALMISEAFTKYLGAPQDGNRINQVIIWLLNEFNIRNYISILDTKRAFTQIEKERQLAYQNYVCYIDGLPLDYNDAHAAHIVSHANTGKSIPENMKMVRACHNTAMGTMNLEQYKIVWLENNKKVS